MNIPSIEMVPLDKIRDNIWRDKRRNPINPEKVSQIAESIVSTGEFWIGVYGRRVAGGFVELAFGHTRAEAAKAVDTGDVIAAAKAAGLKKIPVAIREFTDGEMLMRMVRENLRGELPVVLEAVSAAVRALAEGKIEVEPPDPKTKSETIRYAPSFVPEKKPSCSSELHHPYTTSSIAKFLGGIYTVERSEGRIIPSDSVRAALGILELEERKIDGITPRTFENKPIREIIPMVSDIKKRQDTVVARRDKTAAEIAAWREEQLELQKKSKAEAEKADVEHRALVQKAVEAKRDEDIRKADRLMAEMKEKDERAKAKEALYKVRRAELEKAVQAKKEWEAQQRIQDAYMPIRRDVEDMIGKLETIVSERNPFREAVKSLSTRKGIKPEDRQRIRRALMDVSNWYGDWAAPQFAPEMKAAQKVAAIKKQATLAQPKGKGGA